MAATELKNIRIPDETWFPAGPACKALGSDRSKVARAALDKAVAMQKDPVLKRALRLAQERGTSFDAIEREALEAYLEIHRPAQRSRRSA